MSTFAEEAKELVKLSNKSKWTEERFSTEFEALQAKYAPAPAPVRETVVRTAKPEKSYPERFIDIDELDPVYSSVAISDRASHRFTQVPTTELVKIANTFGYHVYEGKGSIMGVQRRNLATMPDGSRVQVRPNETAPHALTLRHRERDGGLLERGQKIVQIVLRNGGDLSTELSFSLGTFVCWCSNQSVSQQGGFAVSLRHRNLTVDNVSRSFASLISNVDTMLQHQRILESITLTMAQAVDFAARAIETRFLREEANRPTPSQLLAFNNTEQESLTLDNVYQNVQRNLLGSLVVGAKTKNGTRQLKGIEGVKQVIELNERLDDTLYKYAREEINADFSTPAEVWTPDIEPAFTVVA